jgi:hypothetical protein
MKRPRSLWLALLVCLFSTQLVQAGEAWVPIPPLFAQAEGVKPAAAKPVVKKSINRVTLLIRAAAVAGFTMLLAACSYLGLFPWLIRQRTLPLNAFAIATIVTSTSFFILILCLFWKELQILSTTGSPGWIDNLPWLFIILLMLVINIAVWSYHRSAAKKIRAMA